MSNAIQSLLSILDLETLEHNLFRGSSPQSSWQRVFGGQVVGQAVVAATRTVQQDRSIHSLHSYFMQPGDPNIPIIYEVDRIRDGKSFTTRRVVAIQHGEAIFSMSASFHVFEEGLSHQFNIPDVPQPEALIGENDLKALFMEKMPEPIRHYWESERPIELRPISFQHYLSGEKQPPHQNIWLRTTGPLPDDIHIHQCVLAYASDMTLLDTSLRPHGRTIFNKDIQVASLDHAMWFHRRFRVDDWLLYAQDTPSAFGSRGVSRGLIFNQNGELVASTAQEGLIRLMKEKKES